jgi:hypothetical protein
MVCSSWIVIEDRAADLAKLCAALQQCAGYVEDINPLPLIKLLKCNQCCAVINSARQGYLPDRDDEELQFVASAGIGTAA